MMLIKLFTFAASSSIETQPYTTDSTLSLKAQIDGHYNKKYSYKAIGDPNLLNSLSKEVETLWANIDQNLEPESPEFIAYKKRTYDLMDILENRIANLARFQTFIPQPIYNAMPSNLEDNASTTSEASELDDCFYDYDNYEDGETNNHFDYETYLQYLADPISRKKFNKFSINVSSGLD